MTTPTFINPPSHDAFLNGASQLVIRAQALQAQATSLADLGWTFDWEACSQLFALVAKVEEAEKSLLTWIK